MMGTAPGEAPEPPRHCPRCRRRRGGDSPLCFECGEALRPSSYCDVCERYWDLPAGDPCPKHEAVPLAAGPAPPEWRVDPGGVARWVLAGTCGDAIEAELARGLCHSEGIPAFLENTRMGGRDKYLVATGGIRIKVPEELAAEARALLGKAAADPESRPEAGDSPALWWLLALIVGLALVGVGFLLE